jgi:succinate dehydrogenase / fumarate reductase cytochrome b subunit
MNGFLTSWFGDLIMFGATWAIIYHMLGRLRHVIWDFGYCLDIEQSELLAIGMIICSVLMTILFVVVL